MLIRKERIIKSVITTAIGIGLLVILNNYYEKVYIYVALLLPVILGGVMLVKLGIAKFQFGNVVWVDLIVL